MYFKVAVILMILLTFFLLCRQNYTKPRQIWQARAYICSVTNAAVCLLYLILFFCSSYLSWRDLLSATKGSGNN